jgi:hypothetical protein
MKTAPRSVAARMPALGRPFALALVLVGCGSEALAPRPLALDVTLVHGSPPEIATRDQLMRLSRAHDLSHWSFTRTIAIDEEAIPHSHPVLTLHTRHLASDDELLSTFIHEETHWFLEERNAAAAAAVQALRAELPGLPVGFPDGAQSEQSSYEHLIVILLERDGLVSLVGEERTAVVFAFWEADHYRALYRAVREHEGVVRRIAGEAGLLR